MHYPWSKDISDVLSQQLVLMVFVFTPRQDGSHHPVYKVLVGDGHRESLSWNHFSHFRYASLPH